LKIVVFVNKNLFSTSDILKKILYGSLAQLGEHLPYKQRVVGSSPTVPTTNIRIKCSGVFLFCLHFFNRT
jgi:hypothetical protein